MFRNHTPTEESPRRIRRGSRLVAILFAIAAIASACSSGGTGGTDTISLGDDTFAPEIEGGDVESSAEGDAVNFSYDTFDGNSVSFADLPDGPVVLNFFASWCPSCVSELPDFETVSQNLDGQVTFLGLATSDREDASIELVADTGITFPTGQDQSGEIFRLFEGIAMPTTVFLDEDHQVIRVHSGVLNVETLTETINTDLLS